MRATSHWLRFLAEQRRPAPARDRWFESVSLQRGVACEPDFRGTGGEVVQGLCIFWNGRAREPSQAGVFIRNE